MRAILVAAKERDLFAEFGHCVRIPDAANATLQAWDTNSRELFEGADGVTMFTARAEVPSVLRPFLVQVLRSDSQSELENVHYKRLADCGVDDFFRVRSALGVVSVKTYPTMVAGDRPVQWTEVHSWLGVADELGEG